MDVLTNIIDVLIWLGIFYAIGVLITMIAIYHATQRGEFTVENEPTLEWLLEYSPAGLAFLIALGWPYYLWHSTISRY